MQYTVLFTPDEESGGFIAEVPALPGCHTQGETLEEAKIMAKEAIELYLETLQDRGIQSKAHFEPSFDKAE